MSIKELESAVTQLPPSELAEFAEWFESFMSQAWDDQIERDVQAGHLDKLIQKAERDFETGQYKPL